MPSVGSTVPLSEGLLQGQYHPGNSQVLQFLGVQYALPPVRFSVSQHAVAWKGITKALQFAPVCPQPNRASREMSESKCLALNVWCDCSIFKILNCFISFSAHRIIHVNISLVLFLYFCTYTAHPHICILSTCAG